MVNKFTSYTRIGMLMRPSKPPPPHHDVDILKEYGRLLLVGLVGMALLTFIGPSLLEAWGLPNPAGIARGLAFAFGVIMIVAIRRVRKRRSEQE